MSSSDALRELIGEMTRAEKRFFTLSSMAHEGRKEWLELFEYLEAGKNPPSKNKSSISQAVMRNYLQERLLESMAAYYRPHVSMASMQEKALQIHILIRKGLFKFADKRIRALLRDAQEQEQWLVLLDVLPLQRKLSLLASRFGLNDESLAENLEIEQQVLQKLSQIHEYNAIYHQFVRIQNGRGQLGDLNQHPDIQHIMDHPLLKDESNATCHQSRLLLYTIKSRLMREMGDWEASHTYRKLVVAEHERFPEQIREKNQEYVNALLFLYTSASRVNDEAVIQEVIEKMQRIPGTHRGETDLIRLKGGLLECLRILNMGTYTENLPLVRQLEPMFERYRKRISAEDQLLFLFVFGYIHFGAGAYAESLRWILKILQETQERDRVDIHVAARIIFLIIHFELGNTEVLKYAIRSLYRMLLHLNRKFSFEQALLALFRRIPSIQNRQDLNTEFSKLLTLAKELMADPMERKAFDLFHYRAWLESKVTGVPFGKVVQHLRNDSGSAA